MSATRKTTYVVIRHGSNAANQSMTPRWAIGFIEATNRDEANRLAVEQWNCYANQTLEFVPISRAKKADLEEASFFPDPTFEERFGPVDEIEIVEATAEDYRD